MEREKSIQVFLITSAEKTANEKKNEGKKIKDRKKKSLAGKIFLVLYFSNYHSVVECFNVQEFSII